MLNVKKINGWVTYWIGGFQCGGRGCRGSCRRVGKLRGMRRRRHVEEECSRPPTMYWISSFKWPCWPGGWGLGRRLKSAVINILGTHLRYGVPCEMPVNGGLTGKLN